MTPERAPHLRPATEAEIEASTAELMMTAGWFPAKTDAAQINRKSTRGSLPLGFPDHVFLLALPGTPLCLAALVEFKTAKGKLRASQVAMHQRLQQQFGLGVFVVRDPDEAQALIAEGRRVKKLFKEMQL